MKLNTGTAATTLNVLNTGQPLDVGNPAFIWHGSNASNVANLVKTTMGIAFFPGDTAQLATLRIGFVSNPNSDVTLTAGVGLTLGTLDMNGGTVTLNNGATTATVSTGKLTVIGTGGVTTLTVDGGTVVYNSTGTLATAIVSEDGELDSRRTRSRKRSPIRSRSTATRRRSTTRTRSSARSSSTWSNRTTSRT